MRGTKLSFPERQFLELRLLGKWGLRRTARAMGRDHPVLSREVARNRGRVPVSERPDDGLPRHLESDSMVWRSWRGLLSAQVDPVLMVARLRPCPDRTAGETPHALRRCVETLPHGFVRDVSFDDGGEGARHLALREECPGVMTCFCAPHSPWQKPHVENLNRVIRHWLPRKTKAHDLAAVDWRVIEERLNNLPRKSLGYLTPNEALAQHLAGGALRA